MGFSHNFLWLIIGLVPFLLSSGCGDLEPEMQDTRTVVLKMDFNKRSSSRSSQVSAADIAAYQTHLILALDSLESIFPWTASSSYQNHYHNSLAKALMIPPAEPMPKSGQVTMEIPLNTKNMRIAAFLFKQDYDMPQLKEMVREVGYFGESEPFSIGTNTNSRSLGITLHSVFPLEPDYDDLDDGGGDFGGGDFDVGTDDFTAPTVSFGPANGTEGVGVNWNITITFSEAVRNIDNTELTNNNIDSHITLKLNNASGSNINFDATINVNKKVITINPVNNLSHSQVVYVAIGATLEDSSHNAITAANATFTTIGLQSIVATAPSGNGISGDPYLISNLAELSYISQNLGGTNYWASGVYIKQTADIDATATKYWDDADGDSDGDKYNDANDITDAGNDNGFSPIGSSSTRFTGEYDGGGYSISNLTIKRTSTQKVGLFGYTSGATIRNLSVINDNITGSSWVGSLVGIATSTTIDNCSASGNVASNDITGGLVGYFYCGSSCTNSIIRNSYSTARVIDGQSGRTGGLVGFIHNSTILNSYSIGSVVSSRSTRGGLVGYKSSGSTITDSFYDSDTSGQSDTGKGIGKTTSLMKTLATFTDTSSADLTGSWDFFSTWEIDSSGTINDGYPYLK